MKRYSVKQMLAASLATVMVVTAMPNIAYAEDAEQNTVETQETTTEIQESGQETQAAESEVQEEQNQEETQASDEQNSQIEEQSQETDTVSEDVSLSQKFEIQPGKKDAKNSEGKACFVSGTDPESIQLKESTGEGWNITALGELRPEQFELTGAFSNMVITGVSVESREDDNQISDTIVLTTKEAVNAGGVNEQNEYVMDKNPTGKLTVASGVFGQNDPIVVETPVETPNIALKDLKADGEAVEKVPADAKTVTGTLVIDGKLEDYAYFFSPDAQVEDGKRKNEVVVLNVGEGLSSSTISAGDVSGEYNNELGFEVELKDISAETGLITVPQGENVFHTALTVSIPLEVKTTVEEDATGAEESKGDAENTDADKKQEADAIKDTGESAKAEEAGTTEEQKTEDVTKKEDASGETKTIEDTSKESQKTEATKNSENKKQTVENVNKIFAHMKSSPAGKLVANTKAVVQKVQTAIASTKDPKLELDTDRTTYYGGESVNKLKLKLSGPVTFKKDKIAKLTEKNYGDYFILGDGFAGLKITDIDLSSSNDTELTLVVSGKVNSDNGYYKDGLVKVNTPVLSGYDDLLTAEVAVDELKVSLTNLEADGDEVDSINSDAKNITGTIEIEKVDGIDTYFKAEEAFTKKPISLELGGAFRGAKSKVTIDSKNGNKLKFKITVTQRPMTEDYGTIKVSGSYMFTNSELTVPDLKINKIGLESNKASTIEQTDDGLKYTFDVDIKGGTLKEELTADDLQFTAPFNNQTDDMNIQMKKNADGEMNGFTVAIILNPDKMGNSATGTMSLRIDKVYYPDGEHTYGLPLSLNLQDNYVKPKESTESGEEVQTGAVVGDLLTNVFVYTVASAIMEANPITAGLINVGVGALSSFLSGNYTAEKESDRDVLMKEMQDNLNTTLQHIDAATQETKDYISFKSAQSAQDNVNELANKMKDIYSTDINFVNATKTIMEINTGAMEASDAEYVDEILQNIYSSEALTNKKGIINQTYKDNLIQLGRKLLDAGKDDYGNKKSAFDNYEYICQNVYGLNCEGFDNRKTTNEDLLTVYEYGYKIMITAVCYDIQKHKAFNTELDKKIQEQNELLANNSLSKEKKEIVQKNKKTYVNLRKNVQSAISVSEYVLKQLESQNTDIQNAYNSSKAQLDKEVAAYNSEKRIAKCYWLNKDLSLNATIEDVNANIRSVSANVYDEIWRVMRVQNKTTDIYPNYGDLGVNSRISSYVKDESGFFNSWKLPNSLAFKDSETKILKAEVFNADKQKFVKEDRAYSNQFYNSITENDVLQIKKKLEQKNSSEMVMDWLGKFVYIDGKPYTDVMKTQNKYSVIGIHLDGWQESNDSWGGTHTDTFRLWRNVKYMDARNNISEKRTCWMSFDVWHTNKEFFWFGVKQVRLENVKFLDGKALNNRNPEGVICIKNAY